METGLYIGRVSHSRFKPAMHRFSYGISMILENIGGFDDRGTCKTLPLWIQLLLPLRRRDHLKNYTTTDTSLRETLSTLVYERSGITLDSRGAVYLLSGMGFLWHRFNPASFYYCFDGGGRLQCLVAEVTNTPWKEQSHYVLDARDQQDQNNMHFRCHKDFHVSPFMPMDTIYRWRLSEKGPQLIINIAVESQARPLFNANLTLVNRPLSLANLIVAFVRQPLMSLSVSLRIYWQAFRLWLKSTPFYSHPRYSSGDKR